MTYREKIQEMIFQIQKIYDEAEYLRDNSDYEGQQILNQVRRVLPSAWGPLQNLDNSLSDEMANVKI